MNMLEDLYNNNRNKHISHRVNLYNEIYNFHYSVNEFYDSDTFTEWCHSNMRPANMLMRYNGEVIEFLFDDVWYPVNTNYFTNKLGYYNSMPVYYMGLAIIFILCELYNYLVKVDKKLHNRFFNDIVFEMLYKLQGHMDNNKDYDIISYNFKINDLFKVVGKHILIS